MENIIVPYVIHKGTEYFAWMYFVEKMYKIFSKYQLFYKTLIFFKELKSDNNKMIIELYHKIKLTYLKSRLYFQEVREKKEKKHEAWLNKMKREKKVIEDEFKEKELWKKHGICMCSSCKHFVNPETLHALGGDQFKKEFNDIENDIFSELKFNCKCGKPFHSKMLAKYAEKHGNKSAIEYLNKKKEDLVYVNLNVVKHETKRMYWNWKIAVEKTNFILN